MNQPPDLIGLYARLDLARKQYQSAGQPLPPDLTRAILAVEARAQSMLSPQQIQAAQHHVHQAQQRLIADQYDQIAREQAAQADRAGREVIGSLTQGAFGERDGLTPEQFKSLVKGQKVKIDPKYRKFDRKAASADVRERTKRIDPEGKGYSLKEWERRLDQLAETVNDPKRWKEVSAQYRMDPAELRKLANNWAENGLKHVMERRERERFGSDKPTEVEPTDDHRRRAQLLDATTRSATREEEFDMLSDSIRPESLMDDSPRGDVARAFAEVEAREEHDDVA